MVIKIINSSREFLVVLVHPDKHWKCLQNLLGLLLREDTRPLKYAVLADHNIGVALLRRAL